MTQEKSKLICWNYDILPGKKICINCTAHLTKLFNQTEPEEKEVKVLEESMKADDRFFEVIDFVNQSIKLFDSSPLKAIKPNRTVKLCK